MSSEPIPVPGFSTNLGTSSLSSDASPLPLWDRLSTWASENKVVVYTIAGVAVVVSGAGVAYYLSDSRKGSKEAAAAEDKKRLSKKERRKAKQEKEKEKSASEGEAAQGKPHEQCKLDQRKRTPEDANSFASTSKATHSRVRSVRRHTTNR